MALGHRPPQNLDEFEIDAIRGGWQHEAASRVEREFRDSVMFPSLTDGEKAFVRFQSGSGAGQPMSLRDLDLGAMNVQDVRRLEVDGSPLHGGAQLAVDTTNVSALHCDGTSQQGAANVDGVRLLEARRRKERTFPELAPRSRCRLVVLANEVGGRWSTEALVFLRLLARAKARSEPPLMRMRAQQAWKLRWLSILACASARAVAVSLLGFRSRSGVDGVTPHLHEVEGDLRSGFVSAWSVRLCV